MSVFGEIVEPGTRVAWEDWDDVSQGTENTELKWTNIFEVPDTVDLLLILDGKHISDTVRLQEQDSIELINTVKEASLSLYKIKLRNAYICILKDYNLLLSSEIVELLRDFIEKSKDIIVFLNKPLAEYQTSNLTYQPCVIRCLKTTKNLTNLHGLNFPKLEQPNIISGVAAGVITLREHYNLGAMAVVIYMEYLENSQLEEVYSLLQNLDISVSTNQIPNSVANSNLYI
ncbi:uncharacterized protein LOC123713719 [Pieris brassicae]|uniref:Proteasome assembly chaperone 1 n=1 Tax=Pieris brassicae TaxID=7116 RepID=A0A9P0XGK3_PIEBR|nr:uncharacterized protein LOC123713719 [Pieris brassicae]CAH4034067.1 unnamed protein product [Pieris brassicae]